MANIRGRSEQVRRLIEWAEERGWSVSKTRGDHLRFQHPVAGVTFSSFTPSCRRCILNATADMKRKMKGAGIDTNNGW